MFFSLRNVFLYPCVTPNKFASSIESIFVFILMHLCLFVCQSSSIHRTELKGSPKYLKKNVMESSAILQLHYLLFRIRRLGTFATNNDYNIFVFLFSYFISLFTSSDDTRSLFTCYVYLTLYAFLLHATHPRGNGTPIVVCIF